MRIKAQEQRKISKRAILAGQTFECLHQTILTIEFLFFLVIYKICAMAHGGRTGLDAPLIVHWPIYPRAITLTILLDYTGHPRVKEAGPGL